jgi:hypothetical protein
MLPQEAPRYEKVHTGPPNERVDGASSSIGSGSQRVSLS